MQATKTRRRTAWPYLPPLLILVAVLYMPGLSGGFFYDDIPTLIYNRAVQISHLSPEALLASLGSSTASPFGRPLSMLSFALNHVVSDGLEPTAFKQVNLAIHLANGLLAFLLVDMLAIFVLQPDVARRLALWVAAAWLLHPIQVSTVLYVSQRMTELATLFGLAGFVLYLWGRRRPMDAAAWAAILVAIFLCWPAAFLSKETGALWPLFIADIEIVLLSRGSPSALRIGSAFLAIFMLGIAAASWYLGIAWIEQGYEFRGFGLMERLLTESRALWFYAGLIVLPYLPKFALYHDDFGLSHGLFNPLTTAIAIASLVVCVWLLLKYVRRAPLLSLGIAWFLVGHGLESTVLPLILVQEHRNYLPSLGLLLACADAGRILATRLAGYLSPRMLGAIALVPLVWLAVQTGLRANQYGSELRRTQIEAGYHPDSALAHLDAGRVLAEVGRRQGVADPVILSEAQVHYELAARLDPQAKQPQVSMIKVGCELQRKPDPDQLDELERRMRNESFLPGEDKTLLNFVTLDSSHPGCLSLSQVSAIYMAMLENPSLSRQERGVVKLAFANRLLAAPGHDSQARSLLESALIDSPDAAVIRLRYASLLATLGEIDAARAELARAKALRKLNDAEFAMLGGRELENNLDTASESK